MLTAFISAALNSLSIVVSFSPFCTCMSLLPSKVQTLFTFLPSAVSSSNSSPSLNLISVFLKGLVVFSVYIPSFSVSSTTGLTLLPILRVTIPTPEKRDKLCFKIASYQSLWNSNLPDTSHIGMIFIFFSFVCMSCYSNSVTEYGLVSWTKRKIKIT